MHVWGIIARHVPLTEGDAAINFFYGNPR
jgi:hypothetical protein